MAKNTTAHPDIIDFEDYPDWIELQNTTGTAVDLGDYFLSDDPAEPYKWNFPVGTTIEPNGYFLVWTDGHDAVPGDERPRGYWPWLDFTVAWYHTNFNLSSAGETVVLTKATGTGTSTLINQGAVWKYLDDGSDQSTQWRSRTFDDSAWSSGPAELGYGDDDEATVIDFGPDPDDKHITSYFRHTFSLALPGNIHELSLDLLADDGAIVYLNGAEVVRFNMPEGAINSETTASSFTAVPEEREFTTYQIDPSLLVAGDNVIAVEVHQGSGGSADVSMDLSLTASFFSSATQVDTVTYGQQIDDISYGRNPANPNQWVSFIQATPSAANSGGIIPDLTQESTTVNMSPAGGFFSGGQDVSLSSTAGEIRYTTDGSLPTPASPLYTNPIFITSNTVVRARSFENGKVPGAVKTSTYFIDETASDLPVISIAASDASLFDDNIGIYSNTYEPAQNGQRVHKRKDAPASIEYFSPDGTQQFAARGGIRIAGENNWRNAQKGLNFYTRGKYGDDPVKYDLFPGSGIVHHQSLTMRNGGDNWPNAMLRDAMLPAIVEGQLKLDTTNYQPVVVYINGAYWGIHNLRSRTDGTWFSEMFNVNDVDLDYLGYAHHTSGSTTLGAFEGNTDNFLDLLAFLQNDMTDDNVWATVESRIDIDNFIDFIAAETYVINTSWRHNREFWRERKPGAKWQWFLPDIDRGFNAANLTADGELDELLRQDPVLERLRDRPQFITRLAQRTMAHRGSTFAPARLISIIENMDTETAAEAVRHSARWEADGGYSMTKRAEEIQEMKDFATQRHNTLVAELKAELNISDDPITLFIAASDPAHGKILLNGVPIPNGSIEVFPNLDFDLTAVPNPGYAFNTWTGVSETGPKIELNLSANGAITAHFSPSSDIVIPNPLTSDFTVPADATATASGDIIVPPGVTLTLQSGSQLLLPDGINLRVQGTLDINGTTAHPVLISGRNEATWGGISFENTSTTSTLEGLIIRNASQGFEPITYPYAISGLNSDIVLDNIDIDHSAGPIFARGGSTILKNSTIRTPFTGDCINVKGGYAETYDCIFHGNNAIDTDAIDYDGVTNGIIRNNRIYRFEGFNSDGIDVGEQCVDVLIENNYIYYNSDKGVSVGQGSTVILKRNLIVGCGQGVGIKDTGSYALIDQNTFVDCDSGVGIFEKNFGAGGGSATITNNIFSKTTTSPVSIDIYSTASVSWNLSDTTAIAGTSNILTDPLFVNPGSLNFQLQPSSPAINGGDPAHALDPDSTRADIGALYTYSPDHYPFSLENTIVIHEVLANSATDPDWIELHNRSTNHLDISGWFLSDSSSDLLKYRIPENTILPPGGHVVFYENTHFGSDSIDPGRITPFALSDVGETLYLSSAENNQLTSYRNSENFGPSMPGTTLGYYYKPSTDTWNFVPLATPTPGTTNSGPLIGPIVITEIMFDPPAGSDAEYIELMNVSDENVTLYDSTRNAGWRITDGIEYEFPAANPITLAPGERLVLARHIPTFNATYSLPPGTQLLEWTTGKLSNGGERLQLGRPAGLDSSGIRQFARVDRVNYDNSAPWPQNTSGTGFSLDKIFDHQYGNDYANWQTSFATPGSDSSGDSFDTWIAGFALSASEDGKNDDPDGDGLANLLEYALGTDPSVTNHLCPLDLATNQGNANLTYEIRTDRPGLKVQVQHSTTMAPGSWQEIHSSPTHLSGSIQSRAAYLPTGTRGFFRLHVEAP